MSLKHYRKILRRIRRLPLDEFSIQLAKDRLAQAARTNPHVVRPLYDRALEAMDNILLYRKFKQFDVLLDIIYKYHTKQWVQDLYHTRYTAFRHSWPQVHVIDDFGDDPSKQRYHQELQKVQPKEFSIFTALQLQDDPEFPAISPVSREPASTEVINLQEKIFKFHAFLQKNGAVCLGLKIHPLEIFYTPNRNGLPQSVATREAILRKKIGYAKELLAKYRPIEKAHIERLIQFVRSDEQPNLTFKRYMLRQQQKEKDTLSPLVKKYVHHKQLIPETHNIKFYYREYLVRQFYEDDKGTYHPSPMVNVYD